METKEISKGVGASSGVCASDGVYYSNGVSGSYGVSGSNGVSHSYGVRASDGVSGSCGVSDSYGVRECAGIQNCMFCFGVEGEKYYLFNREIKRNRFWEIFYEIQSFDWYPVFYNWDDCQPQNVDNDIAWSKMPQEMREYIFSLPEFNQKVWDKLTGK